MNGPDNHMQRLAVIQVMKTVAAQLAGTVGEYGTQRDRNALKALRLCAERLAPAPAAGMALEGQPTGGMTGDDFANLRSRLIELREHMNQVRASLKKKNGTEGA